MVKNYLGYLYRSKKPTLMFSGLSLVALFLSTYALSKDVVVSIAVPTIVSFILTAVFVPIIYNFVQHKKSIDTFYALPVSRKDMLVATQIFIDSLLLVPMLVVTVLGIAIALIGNGTLHIGAFLLYYVIFSIGIIVIVAFNTGTFLQANNLFDGIVIMLAYLIVPFVLYLAFMCFRDMFVYGNGYIDIDTFMSIVSTIWSSSNALYNCGYAMNHGIYNLYSIVMFAISALIYSGLSFWMFKKDFIDRKTERAENVSDKFTAYPLIISAYVFFLLFISISETIKYRAVEMILPVVVIFILFEVANFVYRRKIKVLIKDIIFFAISIALCFGICFIANKTDGFGLAWDYIKEPENVSYYVDTYYYDTVNSAFDTRSDGGEFGKLVKVKYPNASSYGYHIVLEIDEEDMEKSKNAIRLFEDKREELIRAHYDRGLFNGDVYNDGELVVRCNQNVDGDHFYGVSYNYSFPSAKYLTIDDIREMDKYADIYIHIDTTTDYYELTLDDLLK